MYSCSADSSTTTHTATATAAADMESSGYSYGYSFNDSPSSQGLFHVPFPSPVLNQRLPEAVGVAAGVSGGGDSDQYGGVYQMDPRLTCLKLGKRQHLGASSATAAAAPKCQVDGCQAALARAKEYHKRHKVCEVHAKAAVVVVLGVSKRFCQQCSRFHLVSEFDESKRSCRSRLAGHNKRRRKSSNVSTTAAASHGSITASTWHAPSLLSSRSSAALRELIDEHRASTVLTGSRQNSNYWPPRQVTLDLMQAPRLWNSFL